MRKKLLIASLICFMIAGLATTAFSETVNVEYFDKDSHYGHNHDAIRKGAIKVHDPVVVDDSDYEAFDYGTFLDLVLYETKDKKIQIINKNSWEIGRNEITSLVGAKVNLWSLFKKKDN